VSSVFSVLKAFEFLRDSDAEKAFNTQNTEGTETFGIIREFFTSRKSLVASHAFFPTLSPIKSPTAMAWLI
jgi:hypothetical protein